jgi:hypothetical protein
MKLGQLKTAAVSSSSCASLEGKEIGCDGSITFVSQFSWEYSTESFRALYELEIVSRPFSGFAESAKTVISKR